MFYKYVQTCQNHPPKNHRSQKSRNQNFLYWQRGDLVFTWDRIQPRYSFIDSDPLKEADFKYTYELNEEFARNFLSIQPFLQWQLSSTNSIWSVLLWRILIFLNSVLSKFYTQNKDWNWFNRNFSQANNISTDKKLLMLMTREKMLFVLWESTHTSRIMKGNNNSPFSMTCQSLSEAWEVSDLKEKAQQKLWQPFQREVQIKLFNPQAMPIKPFSIGSQGTLILCMLIQTSLLFKTIKSRYYMVPFFLF